MGYECRESDLPPMAKKLDSATQKVDLVGAAHIIDVTLPHQYSRPEVMVAVRKIAQEWGLLKADAIPTDKGSGKHG